MVYGANETGGGRFVMLDDSKAIRILILAIVLIVGGFGGLIGQLLHLPGWCCGIIAVMLFVGISLHMLKDDKE